MAWDGIERRKELYQSVRNRSPATGGAPTPAMLGEEMRSLSDLKDVGFVVRTRVGTWEIRKLTAGPGIGLTDANGAGNDPVLSILVSDADKLLGRISAGSGDVELIDCTAAGRSLIAAQNDAAQRALLNVPYAGYNNQPFSITPESLAIYQNRNIYPIDVFIVGGTVAAIEFSRNGTDWFNTGVLYGILHLSPSDRIRLTYTVAPTMTGIPR